MVYSYYTPTYYSTLHDSLTSLCKTILPFSFKKRPLPAAEHKLSKLQSGNLKWQQDSFHQVLNLMGLHKEGIVAESEVSAFRTHLLDTLIASPPEQEHPVILRDKLLFLQVSVNKLYFSRKRWLFEWLIACLDSCWMIQDPHLNISFLDKCWFYVQELILDPEFILGWSNSN